jgi:adenine-specific DNA methylase
MEAITVTTAQDLAEGSPFVNEIALAIWRAGLFDEEVVAVKKTVNAARSAVNKGRKRLGKIVTGAKVDYWKKYGGKSLEIALNDTVYSKASTRTRTYKMYKEFFKKEWQAKKYFTIDELKKDVLSTFGGANNMLDAHGFLHGYRFQIIPWSNGVFYEGGELATKPICRKMKRGVFLNIFHRDARNTTDYDKYTPTFRRF